MADILIVADETIVIQHCYYFQLHVRVPALRREMQQKPVKTIPKHAKSCITSLFSWQSLFTENTICRSTSFIGFTVDCRTMTSIFLPYDIEHLLFHTKMLCCNISAGKKIPLIEQFNIVNADEVRQHCLRTNRQCANCCLHACGMFTGMLFSYQGISPSLITYIKHGITRDVPKSFHSIIIIIS